jgi:hypothetical protein
MAGRLGIAEEEIENAIASPSPSNEEIEEILGTVDEAAMHARAQDESGSSNALRETSLTGELHTFELEGDLPSSEDLADHRRIRDDTWLLVKASWLEHQAVTGDTTDFPDDRALASSYERTNENADDTVDRLWREADRTAKRNALTAELDRVKANQAAALAEAERIREDSSSAYATWRSGWSTQRLPESPGLRQWALNMERLRALQDEWTAQRLSHREAFRSVRQHRGQLIGLLATVGVVAVGGGDLAPVLTRASAYLEDVEKYRIERDEKQRRLATLERGLPKRGTAVDNAVAAEQAAVASFASLVAPYGSGLTSPRDAGVVLARLDQVGHQLDTRDNRILRISGIDARSAEFEGKLRNLLAATPDIASDPPADAARELVRRVKAARDADVVRQTLLTSQTNAQVTLDDAEAKLAGVRDELALLAIEEGVEDLEMLGVTADRSIRVAILSHEIGECESLLTSQGGGRSINDLEADGLDRNLADVNAAITTCQNSRDALSDQEKIAVNEERELERILIAMDGSDAAAIEIGTAQLELSNAVEGAERYTRLVIARFLADEAIRRYREAHQDPVLQRASRYLGLLTDAECTRVGVGDDTKKGPLLSAVYSTGEEKQVPELSSGTRDALYFALRLAAIEESVTRTGPMPIVLDDVLINFDDDRSRAALRCLVTVAATSQVLLFTHHRHVISLAKDALAAPDFVVHDLHLTRRS